MKTGKLHLLCSIREAKHFPPLLTKRQALQFILSKIKMKKIFLFIFILLDGSVLFSAPINAEKNFLPGNDSAMLIKFETEITKAIMNHDRSVFEKLLATGFVYTENASSYRRSEAIEGFISAGDTIEAAYNENMVVHLYGPTGVVTGWMTVKGSNASSHYEHKYRFTDTWSKSNGEWQLVAAHDYIGP